MVFVDCAYVLQDFTSFEGSYDHEYCFNGYYAFKANLNIKNKGLSDFPGGETFEINSFANYISSYSIRINNELSDKSTTNELLKDRLFNKIKLTIEKFIKSEESIEVALDFYINQNYFNKTSYGNFTIFINNTLPLDYINNESINFTFNHPNVALRQEDFIIKHIEKHIIYERDNNYNIINNYQTIINKRGDSSLEKDPKEHKENNNKEHTIKEYKEHINKEYNNVDKKLVYPKKLNKVLGGGSNGIGNGNIGFKNNTNVNDESLTNNRNNSNNKDYNNNNKERKFDSLKKILYSSSSVNSLKSVDSKNQSRDERSMTNSLSNKKIIYQQSERKKAILKNMNLVSLNYY